MPVRASVPFDMVRRAALYLCRRRIRVAQCRQYCIYNHTKCILFECVLSAYLNRGVHNVRAVFLNRLQCSTKVHSH